MSGHTKMAWKLTVVVLVWHFIGCDCLKDMLYLMCAKYTTQQNIKFIELLKRCQHTCFTHVRYCYLYIANSQGEDELRRRATSEGASQMCLYQNYQKYPQITAFWFGKPAGSSVLGWTTVVVFYLARVTTI